MKISARELVLIGLVVLLVLIFRVELRRGEQLPPSAPMLAYVAAPPVPPGRCAAVGFPGRPPRKIVDVKPVYPDAARAAHVTGVVLVSASIDEQGRVIDPHVVRSIPVLDRAALEAVSRWRFQPATLRGSPVCVTMTLTVSFGEGRNW